MCVILYVSNLLNDTDGDHHHFSPNHQSVFNRCWEKIRYSDLSIVVCELLMVPKSQHVTRGDRAFAVRAPQLWNSLPEISSVIF